uniref:Uncharacterized protein n=1 Tax=Candidatus Kentrum sp. FM TaxID=2126340 RepID=A0A450SBD0_9GAMM|nr:MAG: hypothetical protein BECKFM1743A_GA0114220_1002713 [Candidatus Kentron sp. FM]VFJ49480.1 MAG: hypothetical protein BECKFM1743C_GA0114222_1007113 [Candidatus Kentron sp. FM]
MGHNPAFAFTSSICQVPLGCLRMILLREGGYRVKFSMNSRHIVRYLRRVFENFGSIPLSSLRIPMSDRLPGNLSMVIGYCICGSYAILGCEPKCDLSESWPRTRIPRYAFGRVGLIREGEAPGEMCTKNKKWTDSNKRSEPQPVIVVLSLSLLAIGKAG